MRRNSIKNLLCVILSIITLLVLVGCGGQDGTKANTKGRNLPGYETGKINLVFFVHENQAEYERVAKAFCALEENEKVNIIVQKATESYYSELLNSYIGAQTPDIVFMKTSEIMPFLSYNRLVALDSYLESSKKLSLSDLWEVNNCYRYDGTSLGQGKLYGIVKDFSPDWPLIYNANYVKGACQSMGEEGTQILNKLEKSASYPETLGTSSPSEYALTWTEFYKLTSKIKELNPKVNGTILDTSPEMQLMEWIQMQGEYLFTEDDKQCKDLVNNEKIRAAFELFRKLQDGNQSPAPWSNSTEAGNYQIKKGTVGSKFCGRWGYAEFDWTSQLGTLMYAADPLPDNFDSLEKNNYTISSAVGGAMALCITSKCEYPEIAFRFIEYFMTTYQVKVGYNISGNKTLVKQAFLDETQEEEILKLNTFFYNLSQNAGTLRYNKYIGTDTIYNIMWMYFQDYFYSSKHDASDPNNADWIKCLENIRTGLNNELKKHY